METPDIKAFGGPVDTMGSYGEGAVAYGLMADYLAGKNARTMSNNRMDNPYFQAASPSVLAYGGHVHGADFNNGVVFVNAGGTHETNPNGGVPAGVDYNGTENLVEGGELIFNDFVYSNRIKLPKEQYSGFKLGGKKDYSYADVAAILQKESSERPNDPISRASLYDMMGKLAQSQEELKMKQQQEQMMQMLESMSPEEREAFLQQISAQMQSESAPSLPEQQVPVQENAEVMQPQMPAEPAVQQNACGGKIRAFGGNKFDNGGVLGYLNSLFGTDTDSQLMQALGKYFKPEELDSTTYILRNADNTIHSINRNFIDSSLLNNSKFRQEYPALVHALENGYDPISRYSLSNNGLGDIDFKHGTWTNRTEDNWNGSVDPAWVEMTKGMSDEAIKALTEAQIADKIKATDAYRKGTEWLQASEDNRLKYLQAVLASEDTPQEAKNWAAKYVDANGWRENADRSYDSAFAKRGTHPGTYWKTPGAALRGTLDTNFIIDENGNVELARTDNFGKYDKIDSYSWSDPKNDNTYNYYRLKGAADAAPGNRGGAEDSSNVIYKVKDPKTGEYRTINVGDDGSINPLNVTEWLTQNKGYELTGNEEKDGNNTIKYIDPEVLPRHRWEWPRYAGALGPLFGLGLQLAGVGKPDYSGLNSALDISGRNPMFIAPESIGSYMTYNPLDINYMQHQIVGTGNGNASAIMNNAGTRGAAAAGLLANAYNTQVAQAEAYRQAMESNDAQEKAVEEFNKDTAKFNSQMLFDAARSNQTAYNSAMQQNAQMAMDAAKSRLNFDNDWYGSIYGNIGQGLAALGQIGRENVAFNQNADLAAHGVYGTGDPEDGKLFERVTKYGDTSKKNKVSDGGRINHKKKRGGYTY